MWIQWVKSVALLKNWSTWSLWGKILGTELRYPFAYPTSLEAVFLYRLILRKLQQALISAISCIYPCAKNPIFFKIQNPNSFVKISPSNRNSVHSNKSKRCIYGHQRVSETHSSFLTWASLNGISKEWKWRNNYKNNLLRIRNCLTLTTVKKTEMFLRHPNQ